MKLEVGKKYVRRDGNTTGPLESYDGCPFVFLDPYYGESYTEEGYYFQDRTKASRDLIREYEEPEGEPAVESKTDLAVGDRVRFKPDSDYRADGEFVVTFAKNGYVELDDKLVCGYRFHRVDRFEKVPVVEPGPPTEGPAVCTFNLEPDEQPAIRTFETGATRNLDTNKLDYEGFLSPLVLHSFAKYMHSHRLQKDGTMRDSDNWQAGLPMDVYMKSMWRHFMDVWMLHRGGQPISPDSGEPVSLEEALCAVLFNVQGMLHEHLKKGGA